MFRAFTGALSLALALLVLHWAFPGLAEKSVEVVLKLLTLISATLDLALQNMPAQ